MADYLSYATPERDDDPRAIRLTFSYSGDRIELVDAQRLTMFVPPSDPITAIKATLQLPRIGVSSSALFGLQRQKIRNQL